MALPVALVLALAHAEQAPVAVVEAHYGREHVELVKPLTHLANAYGSVGDARTKRNMLERALGIAKAHSGP